MTVRRLFILFLYLFVLNIFAVGGSLFKVESRCSRLSTSRIYVCKSQMFNKEVLTLTGKRVVRIKITKIDEDSTLNIWHENMPSLLSIEVKTGTCPKLISDINHLNFKVDGTLCKTKPTLKASS